MQLSKCILRKTVNKQQKIRLVQLLNLWTCYTQKWQTNALPSLNPVVWAQSAFQFVTFHGRSSNRNYILTNSVKRHI